MRSTVEEEKEKADKEKADKDKDAKDKEKAGRARARENGQGEEDEEDDGQDQGPLTQAAESLRALVVRHKLRPGILQHDFERFMSELEELAKSWEDQEKSPEQLEKEREERGEPAPNKTHSELMAETIKHDKEVERQKAKEEGRKPQIAIGKTGSIDPMANRLGIPSQTPRPSSVQTRDEQERAAHGADEKIKAIGEKEDDRQAKTPGSTVAVLDKGKK